MMKFDKNIKFGGQGYPPYGANGTYYYWVPLLNSSAGGIEPFKPNIVKNKK